MKRIDFQPVLFDTLKNYSKEKFFTGWPELLSESLLFH